MPNRRGKKQKTNTDGNVYAKQKGEKQKNKYGRRCICQTEGKKNKKQIRTEMYMPYRRENKNKKTNTDGDVCKTEEKYLKKHQEKNRDRYVSQQKKT
jgi:hypothetical protein